MTVQRIINLQWIQFPYLILKEDILHSESPMDSGLLLEFEVKMFFEVSGLREHYLV